MVLSCLGGTLSAAKEATPAAKTVFRRLGKLFGFGGSDTRAFPTDIAGTILVQLRLVHMYILLSPVAIPALGLWLTFTTICSWPKISIQWLTFLFRAAEITVCGMHIALSPVASDDEPGGNGSWLEKGLVCLLSIVGWIFLICCACILEPDPFGGALVMIVVSIIALKTPHEKAWRGCILVFAIALVVVMLSAPILSVSGLLVYIEGTLTTHACRHSGDDGASTMHTWEIEPSSFAF